MVDARQPPNGNGRIPNGGEKHDTALDRHEASSARRQRLIKNDIEDKVPIVSSFFPLDKYLDVSDKLFDSFELFYEKNELDEAYVYGKRYALFCTKEITKHDYFKRGKCKARSLASIDRSQVVVNKLEELVTRMDQEEIAKAEQRQILLEKEEEARRKVQRELEQKQIEDLRKRMEAQKIRTKDSTTIAAEKVEESALAKLQRLSQPQLSPATVPPRSVRWNLPAEPDGALLSQKSSESASSDLPPPLLPPSAINGQNGSASVGSSAVISPPSYNAILNQSSFFGPGKGPTASAPAATHNGHPSAPAYDQVVKPKRSNSKQLPIRQFIAETTAKHGQYLREGKIKVWALQTYQGRVAGSTNGCTVISACVVSRHMETHGGVNDAQVASVIDKECVPLLRSIRNRLDLGAASLIIPSDVHDYLVDHKLLYQHKFAGAAGGNILDPEHSGELLKLLQGEPGKTSHLKAAATLFFREHVVSIVKFPKNGTEAYYDMVDSLPTVNGKGSRTRCDSLNALKVHLAKYCTRKFSDSNIKYIEKNRWDDSMADFDPRVFQAFVWMDLPKPKPTKQ